GEDPKEKDFVKGFLRDDSDYVRVWAAGFLGLMGDSSGLPICESVLARNPIDDKIRALQMRAAIAAGRIGDPHSLKILRIVGDSEDYGLAKYEAWNAIREIEFKNAGSQDSQIKYLQTALADPRATQWAARRLGALKTPAALEVLKQSASGASSPGQ